MSNKNNTIKDEYSNSLIPDNLIYEAIAPDAPAPQVVKVDNTGQGWVIASMIISFPFGLILGLIYFLSKPRPKICVTIAKILVTIVIIAFVIYFSTNAGILNLPE